MHLNLKYDQKRLVNKRHDNLSLRDTTIRHRHKRTEINMATRNDRMKCYPAHENKCSMKCGRNQQTNSHPQQPDAASLFHVPSVCSCRRFFSPPMSMIPVFATSDELMLSCLMVCSMCTKKKKTLQVNDVPASHPH